jgi:hypothetical protein
MIGLIVGLIGAAIGVVTGIAGALVGALAALGGVLLGLAIPFAPVLVIVGVLMLLASGARNANCAPQNPRSR